MKNLPGSLAALSLIGLLSACGGGSGGSSNDPNPSPQPLPETYSINGNTVKGPVENATINVYRVNSQSDDLKGELVDSGTTLRDGSLDGITLSEPLDESYLVEAIFSDASIDLHTQVTPDLSYMLSVVKKAQIEEQKSINVSPLTTLVVLLAADLVAQGDSFETSLLESQRIVENTFYFGADLAFEPFTSSLLVTDRTEELEVILQHRAANEITAALSASIANESFSSSDVLEAIALDLTDAQLDALSINGNFTPPDDDYLDKLLGAPIQHLTIVGTDTDQATDVKTPYKMSEIPALLVVENQLLETGFDVEPLSSAQYVFVPTTLSLDSDSDGYPDITDTDDDNDGVDDVNDDFPLDPLETVDTDGDGIGNNADDDDDNDGVNDEDDAFPLDDTESVDTDGDGIGNNADGDDDNDGVSDGDEILTWLTDPLDPDTDDDGLSDGQEVNEFYTDPLFQDSDNDRMFDGFEVAYGFAPLDASDGIFDTDGDGYANFEEFFLSSNPTDSSSVPERKHWWISGSDNAQSSFLPIVTAQQQPDVRWSLFNISSWTTIVSDRDYFYRKISRGLDDHTLEAVNPVTGATQWEADVFAGLIIDIAAIEERVYYIDIEAGRVHAFNRNSGDLIFSTDQAGSSGEINSIIVNTDKIILPGEDGLYAIDSNASVLWRTPNLSSTYGVQSLFTQGGDIIYSSDDVLRVSMETGDVLASAGLAQNGYYFTAFSGSYTGILAYRSDGMLHRLSNDLTEITWAIEQNLDPESLTLAYGRIYAGIDSQVHVYDELTGNILTTWEVPDGQSVSTNIVIARNTLFVGAGNKTYAIDLETMQTAWSIDSVGKLSLSQHGALVIVDDETTTAYNIDVDSDNDGMPDWWEQYFGLDIELDDSDSDLDSDSLSAFHEYLQDTMPNNADSDSDGLSDGVEVNDYGTDPLSEDSDSDGLSDFSEIEEHLTNPLLADTDGDLISDVYEVINNADPTDANDAELDTDGDGFTLSEEFFNNTDPNDQVSVPNLGQWTQSFGNAQRSGFVNSFVANVSTERKWHVESTSNFESYATDGAVHIISGPSYQPNWISIDANTGETNFTVQLTGYPDEVAWQGTNLYVVSDLTTGVLIETYDLASGERLKSQEISLFATTSFYLTIDKTYILLTMREAGFGYLLSAESDEILELDVPKGELFLPVIKDNSAIFCGRANQFVKIDFSDPITSTEFAPNSDFFSCFGQLMAGAYNNFITHDGNQLISLSGNTFKTNWSIDDVSNQYAVGYGQVFVIRNGNLQALDEITGNAIWTFDTDNHLDSNIIVTPNKVITGNQNITYVIDRHDQSFDVINEGGSLVLSDGLLLIQNNGISAYDVDGDRDEDGMPDRWERRYGLAFLDAADASGDLDSDGLTNLEEFENNSNPTLVDTDGDGLDDIEEVNIHMTRPDKSDTDKDGLSDGDELNTYFTSPIDADSDDDGFSDGQEVLQYGTDPNDPDSLPVAITAMFESFESADIPPGFTIPENSDAAWFITDSDATNGLQSLRSGDITDSQTSEVEFRASFADGVLSFYARVDSESCCDRLLVYVDDQQMISTVDSEWRVYEIPIDNGERTIRFKYSKDSSVSRGEDAVWIDEFRFEQ